MSALMILLNLFIIGSLILALVIGYIRGGADIAIDTLGLLISVVLGIIMASLFGARLERLVPGLSMMAPLVIFGAVWIGGIIVTVPLSHRLLHRVPHHWTKALPNRILGAVLNALRVVIIITIGLLILVSLPFSTQQRSQIAQATIPKTLIRVSGGFGSRVQNLVGDSLGSSLGLFTTTGREEPAVPLHFTTTAGVPSPELEARMVTLVNIERARQGLNPVTLDDRLRDVARNHAQDMLAKGYFAHVNQSNQDPFDRLRQAKIRFYYAGENLALAPSLQQAHQGLMNSPPHRANILSPNYGKIGVGIIDAGRYGLMVVQDFTN
jgi:uncharacterized protein YkwD